MDPIFEIRRMFVDTDTVPHEGMKVALENEVYMYTYQPEKQVWDWVKCHSSSEENGSSESSSSGEFSTAAGEETKPATAAAKSRKKQNRRNILLIELLEIQDALHKNQVQQASDLLDKFIKNHAHKIVEIKNKEKKTRMKTSYNTFISDTLVKLKNESPEITPPMRMRLAVSKWQELFRHPLGGEDISST